MYLSCSRQVKQSCRKSVVLCPQHNFVIAPMGLAWRIWPLPLLLGWRTWPKPLLLVPVLVTPTLRDLRVVLQLLMRERALATL